MNFQYFKMVAVPCFIDKREVGEPLPPSPPPPRSATGHDQSNLKHLAASVTHCLRELDNTWRGGRNGANLNLEKEKYSNRA